MRIKYSLKQTLYIIVFSIIILAGFFWSLDFYVSKRNRNEAIKVMENKVEIFAKIIDDRYMKGPSVRYTYVYKNEQYFKWINNYEHIYIVGNCYRLWVDSLNPNHSLIKENISCP